MHGHRQIYCIVLVSLFFKYIHIAQLSMQSHELGKFLVTSLAGGEVSLVPIDLLDVVSVIQN